ncbi:MAG: DUF983 domain-containing protein [Crocinitomicaceae bacterium]|nr:DUF983 domain-containing protein [Crocinitomicaceae bacterium]
MKCPRCQEGDFFKSNPYDLKKAGDIYTNCSHCDLKYSKEPGFYFGAMFVSYALAVALFVTIWVSMSLFAPQVSVWWQIGIIIGASIILSPYLYALSKIIWINFFIKYDKQRKFGK